MTRIDIAERALTGIFQLEREAGKDIGHLGTCLRLVVGAYISGHLNAALNGLEVDAHARGFAPVQQKDLNTMRALGLSFLPDPRIEAFRQELHAARKKGA